MDYIKYLYYFTILTKKEENNEKKVKNAHLTLESHYCKIKKKFQFFVSFFININFVL